MNHSTQCNFQRMMAAFLCIIFLCSIYGPQLAHGYNSGDETSAHQWIIKKAIEYLEKKQRPIASKFPLNDYLPWLYYGVRYADEHGFNCRWFVSEDDPIYQGGCDTIHHYGYVDDIKLFNAGLPKGGVSVAHPGGFAAPFYAGVLYNQAVNFWPGGSEPNLSDLPKKDGGYITTIFDSTLLQNTWVGGLPFCEAWVAEQNGGLIPIDACPKWPSWASQEDELTPLKQRYKTYEESVENAMIYLGWAIHMLEDMTVPVHALNETGKYHQGWEDDVDLWISDKSFDHLPKDTRENYNYKPCNKCIDGDFWLPVLSSYFNKEEIWSVENFALEARRVALETDDGSAILPSMENYKIAYSFGKGYLIWPKSIAERCVDTAIKLVAAMIEKYLYDVSLSPDLFEENDEFYEAKEISTGTFSDLTFHVPLDEDWYILHIDTDYSDFAIDINYDKSFGKIAARVESEGSSFAGVPVETDYGMKIIMNSVLSGAYRLYLYPFDYRTAEYDMTVFIGTGSLPPDRYEENDTPSTAKEFFTGCDFQKELNIDKVGDDDYYYLYVAEQDRIKVEISFDPTQGELELYLDGIKATDEVSESSTMKRLSISRIGSDGPALVRVTGARNWYSLCMAIDRCIAEGKIFDCIGNCVNEVTANSWIGDGYCDDGTRDMGLRCERFQNDGGDCDPGNYCSPGKINDCVSNCVDEETALSWIGDGYCDDGTWGMDLRCSALNDDGGDCKIKSHDDYGNTCDDAYLLSGANVVNGSIESVSDYDYFKIETSRSLYTFLHIYTTGNTNTYAYLLNSNCVVIAEYNDSNKDTNFHIHLMVHGETYYIALKHSDEETGTGNYTLHVDRSFLGG